MTRHRIDALLDCSPDAVADIFSFVTQRLDDEDGRLLSFVSEPEDERPVLAAVPDPEGAA